MTKKTRRTHAAKDKVAILRKHLIEGIEVSVLCDQYDIQPTLFYAWQRTFFENGEAAFAGRKGKRAEGAAEKKLRALEEKLTTKNEVLAELMEEHVALKKSLGEV